MDTAATPAGAEVRAQAESGGVRLVAATALQPNPHQPRAHFDEAALGELAASIQAHGIIQPLVVTANPERPGTFFVVAGERRWRAAQLAGLIEVPVIVREASPQQLMEWALVENVQRADLNPLEEAAAYRSLMEEFGLTQAEVAERVGKSRPAIANTVRLLQLPPAAQDAVVAGRLSAGHARALLALPGPAAIQGAMDKVLRRDLNVRQTETLVRLLIEQEQSPQTPTPGAEDEAVQTHVRGLESRFRSLLGTRVSLNRNQDGSGRLVVHFYNDEDLDTLYRLLGGAEEHD
jgi:ParB family chromosome partitioning protein